MKWGVVEFIKTFGGGRVHDPKDFHCQICDATNELNVEDVSNKDDVLRNGKLPDMVIIVFKQVVP